MLGGALWNFPWSCVHSKFWIIRLYTWGGQFFSVKSYIVNILGFVGPLVSDSAIRLCHESSRRWYAMKERGCDSFSMDTSLFLWLPHLISCVLQPSSLSCVLQPSPHWSSPSNIPDRQLIFLTSVKSRVIEGKPGPVPCSEQLSRFHHSIDTYSILFDDLQADETPEFPHKRGLGGTVWLEVKRLWDLTCRGVCTMMVSVTHGRHWEKST